MLVKMILTPKMCGNSRYCCTDFSSSLSAIWFCALLKGRKRRVEPRRPPREALGMIRVQFLPVLGATMLGWVPGDLYTWRSIYVIVSYSRGSHGITLPKNSPLLAHPCDACHVGPHFNRVEQVRIISNVIHAEYPS